MTGKIYEVQVWDLEASKGEGNCRRLRGKVIVGDITIYYIIIEIF